jgi:hypothetical protein
MKKLALLSLLILVTIAIALSSCGSNQIQALPTSNVNGNWEAKLTGGTGPAAQLNFMANFNLFVTNGSGNQGLNINDVAFLNANPCFPTGTGGTGAGASGYINLTNNLNNGKITGAIGLTLKSFTGNILTLSADPNLSPPTGELIATASGGSNGTLSNGGVNGGWWLTAGSAPADSGCTAGSATNPLPFIMCQNATTCTTALGPSISPRF